MFQRGILTELNKWKNAEKHKPLILRGSRQVGKTTIVNEFGKTFDNYLAFNLEDPVSRDMFEMQIPLSNLIELLFSRSGKIRQTGNTLIFIDEIQNSPKTITLLRYFYELHPELYVIAAGSLLENLVDVQTSFPVGRVQYMALRPCSFLEFLGALSKNNLLDILKQPNFTTPFHKELMALFNQYSVVGGMPEVVQEYVDKRDVLAIDDVYESLLLSYQEDTEKYVKQNKLSEVVRFVLRQGWGKAAEIVTLTKFADSDYNAREVGESFRLLEKAMLLELVYPTTYTQLPALPETKRMPKLIWFDTGLVNYASNIRKEIICANDILDVWRGRIAEQVTAQELLTLNYKVSQKRAFWIRGKGGGSAEVDFVYTKDSMLFPIEVKSGHNAHLKSLHSFLENSTQDVAIRVWSGPFSIEEHKTTIKHKTFKLINLPFYLIGALDDIIEHL